MDYIKNGDKIKLRKDFYETDYFKGLCRFSRKYIAGLKDIDLTVSKLCNGDSTNIYIENVDERIHTWTDFSMFELVERKPEYKYNVGDIVTIVKEGESYSSYSEWFSENNVRELECDYIGCVLKDGNGKKATVVAREKHKFDTVLMYAIKLNNNGKIVIVNEKAIELQKIKEIKRVAKVGEFIKVAITSLVEFGAYEVGDICEVVESKEDGIYAKTKGTHSCNVGENTSYMYHSEYVVLEGYVPEIKVEEVKLPDEKYGFKIGEEVIVYGKKHKVTGFINNETGCSIYLDNGVVYINKPSYCDREIPFPWVCYPASDIKRVDVPKVGMYFKNLEYKYFGINL